MKHTTILQLITAVTILVSAQFAIAQENERSYMLQITEIEVKIGHTSKFREGMKAYLACYNENGGSRTWSVWNNVGGAGDVYHIVTRRDSWAELDTRDAASRTCWSTIEDSVAPHMVSVNSSFARHLPDWSGQAENYDVVRLHQFRVAKPREFTEIAGTMTEIMKDSKYEHLGTWYRVIGSGSSEIDYFVVEHYENFAAMDDDRPGAYQAIVNAVGEQRARGLWDTFRGTLRDDHEYASELLVRVPDLGREAD